MSNTIDNPQNLELSQCVKTVSEFGSNTYQNICTNTSNTVEWGTLDWVVILLLLVFGLAFVVFLVVCVISFIRMNVDY